MNPSPDGYGQYVTVDDIQEKRVEALRAKLAEKHPHILANGSEVIRQKRAADKVYNEFLALLVREYNENDLNDLLKIIEAQKPVAVPAAKPAYVNVATQGVAVSQKRR